MTTEARKDSETVLGIDYGEATVGIALGCGGAVTPVKSVEAKNIQNAVNEIVRLALENHAAKIILGLPLNYDNKETPRSIKTRQFAKLLRIRLKKPVVFVNEYKTSIYASEEAIELGVSKKRRRILDHISAAVILKKYFEEGPTTSS